MGTEAAKLFIIVESDLNGANKDLKKLDSRLDNIGKSSAPKAKKGMSAFGKIGIAAIFTAAAIGVGKLTAALIKASSNAEETNQKFSVTFSSISKQSSQVANDLANNFGLSQTAAKSLLADTGDLLGGFGFTQQAALDLSKQVNELAVDLASFTNFSGGAEGASAALTKGLLGERESMKSLGIAIMEADLKQLAEDKGIVGELDRQTKAALTLELALKQSKNAIGDFERSQSSFANQSRITKARVDNLIVSFGNGLLPVATLGVNILNDLLLQLKLTADTFKEFTKSSRTIEIVSDSLGILAGVGSVVFELMKDLGKVIIDNVVFAFSELREFTTEFSEGAITVASSTKFMIQTFTALKSILSITSLVFVSSIKILARFAESLIMVTKLWVEFRNALVSGDIRKSFEVLQEQLIPASESIQKLRDEIVTASKEILGTTQNEIANFEKGSEESLMNITNTFTEAFTSIQTKVKSALEAAAKDTTNIFATASSTIANESEKAAVKTASLIKASTELMKRQLLTLIPTEQLISEARLDVARSFISKRTGLAEDSLSDQKQALIQANSNLLSLETFTNEERLLLAEEFHNNLLELEREIMIERITVLDEYSTKFNSILGDISKINQNVIAQDLQRFKDSITTKTDLIDDEVSAAKSAAAAQIAALENIGLSEEELKKRKQKINSELEASEESLVAKKESLAKRLAKKERQAARDSALKQKDFALAQAAISGALAISQAVASAPFPFNLAPIAFATIQTGVQLASIATTPIPSAQSGAIVPPSAGADLSPFFLAAGEEVVPASQRDSNRGGDVIFEIGGKEIARIAIDEINSGRAGKITRRGVVSKGAVV